jgi:hypothetical protein
VRQGFGIGEEVWFKWRKHLMQEHGQDWGMDNLSERWKLWVSSDKFEGRSAVKAGQADEATNDLPEVDE